MTLGAFKIVAAVVTALITTVVAMAYLTVPYVGSACLMIVKDAGDALPLLTKNVALPLLRVGLGNELEQPFTGGWPAAVWLLLCLAPWLALFWARRAPRLDEALARWIVGLALYGAVLAGLIVVVIAGLAMPFAWVM